MKKNQTVQLPVRVENCIRTNKEECTQPLNMDILMHICIHVVDQPFEILFKYLFMHTKMTFNCVPRTVAKCQIGICTLLSH